MDFWAAANFMSRVSLGSDVQSIRRCNYIIAVLDR